MSSSITMESRRGRQFSLSAGASAFAEDCAVHIKGSIKLPDNHIAYRVQVCNGEQAVIAEVNRRFSEFLQLHSEVESGLELPNFPAPKHLWMMSPKEAAERKVLLEKFLASTLDAMRGLIHVRKKEARR